VSQLYARFRELVLIRWVSVVIILTGLFGSIAGFVYWYGPTFYRYPVWQWPFVPDCPLFALLFVIALFLISIKRGAPLYDAWVAFGLIKYGVWTVLVWIVYWINTRGDFTAESVIMALAHTGMVLEGLFLLSFLKMNVPTVLLCAFWFGLSDWMDYGPFETYPHFPTAIIPFGLIKWHTIAVTISMTALYAYLAWRQKAAGR